jgi:hypothetical protein
VAPWWAKSVGGATACEPTRDSPDTASGDTGLVSGLEQVRAPTRATIVAAPNIKTYQILASNGSLRCCAR